MHTWRATGVHIICLQKDWHANKSFLEDNADYALDFDPNLPDGGWMEK